MCGQILIMLSSPCPSEERLPEIAFVTDIRGLCSAGWTPQTCTQAQHARLRRPQLLSCHQCPTLQIAWQEFDEALLTVWYPHIDASPNFVICVTEGGVGLRTDQSGYWTLQPAPVWLGPHHGAERWAGRCETQGAAGFSCAATGLGGAGGACKACSAGLFGAAPQSIR
jgi:hypothetical protein